MDHRWVAREGISGITPENVVQVMEAGAQDAAVIEAILGAPDPAQAAAGLRAAMLAAWAGRWAISAPETVLVGESEGADAPSDEKLHPLSLGEGQQSGEYKKGEGAGGEGYLP